MLFVDDAAMLVYCSYLAGLQIKLNLVISQFSIWCKIIFTSSETVSVHFTNWKSTARFKLRVNDENIEVTEKYNT